MPNDVDADPGLEFGLGALQSPPDERDYPVAALYALSGAAPLSAIPPTYLVPAPLPAVLNQGRSPMCVAFSTSFLKAYQDRRDQGKFFNFDERTFFHQIGGTSVGAYIRDALSRLVANGYPVITAGEAAKHKIKAYYAVPNVKEAIQQAILAFGPIVLITPWYNSWLHTTNGVLPAPDYLIGGHAIAVIGWDSRGLRLRNSWGTTWGLSGDCFMPWKYLIKAWEVWKTVDVIETPGPTPTPIIHRIIVAANARIRIASINANRGCISGWSTRMWGSTASSAQCTAAYTMKGCSGGLALVTHVLSGTFAGRIIHVSQAEGITVI